MFKLTSGAMVGEHWNELNTIQKRLNKDVGNDVSCDDNVDVTNCRVVCEKRES